MPVINRDKEPEEVSPAGLRADGMGEAVSVVRTGPSRPSIDHCGGRQDALGDSLTGRAWTAQRMAGLLARDACLTLSMQSSVLVSPRSVVT